MQDIVVALIDKQRKSGMKEADFARSLGMSRANWGFIKRGVRHVDDVRLAFLRHALSSYPDLWPVVTAYLTTPEIKGLDSSSSPSYNGKRASGTAKK